METTEAKVVDFPVLKVKAKRYAKRAALIAGAAAVVALIVIYRKQESPTETDVVVIDATQ